MQPTANGHTLRLFWKAVSASGGAMVISLLLSVIVSRMLGAEGRGLLAAMQLWPTLLGGLTTLGLPAAVAYHMRRHPRLQASLYGSGLAVVLLVSCTAALASVLLCPYLLPGLNGAQLHTAQLYLVLALPVTALFIYLGGCGQALPDMVLFNRSKVVPVLVQVPVVALLVTARSVTAEHIAFGFLFAQYIVAVWLVLAARKAFGLSMQRRSFVVKAMLAYGFGVWAAEVLGTITLNADKLTITQFLTLRDLGIYSVAYSLSRIVSHGPNSIAAIIFPRNVGRDKATVVDSTARAFRLSFWPVLLIAVPGAALCYPLFPLVFGKDFAPSGVIFPVLVAECLVGTSSWVLAQAFNSLSRPGLVVVRQAGGLLGFAVLSFVLIPPFGIFGAALAALGAAAVRLGATLASFRTGLGVPMPKVLWQREDWHLLLSSVRLMLRKH